MRTHPRDRILATEPSDQELGHVLIRMADAARRPRGLDVVDATTTILARRGHAVTAQLFVRVATAAARIGLVDEDGHLIAPAPANVIPFARAREGTR